MKTAAGIIALFLAQNAGAFAPSSVAKTTALSAATMTAEVTKTPEVTKSTMAPEVTKGLEKDIIKYETEVNSEQKFKVAEVDSVALDPKKRVQTGRYSDREMSVSVPFLKRPSKLDGSHAGDVGFDPLGLSENFDLYTMMEAELRHARLAMLAVVGWPLSELMGPNFMLHGPNHLAPSVLNGFDPLSFIAVAGIFGGFGYFEYKTSLRRVDNTRIGMKHKEDMANVWKYGVPGDYNFDPLNLYSSFGDTADARKAMRELEIAHGRWAMMGITGFAAWEALTGHAIVENSMFFHPNALLPALALAYLGFGFFYEVKSNDQYLFQIEMTSEGEARKENLQRDLSKSSKKALAASKEALKYLSILAGDAAETATELKGKYDQLNEDYTKSKMAYKED